MNFFQYQFKRLKKYCEKYLSQNLTVTNVVGIFKLAFNCNAEELIRESSQFIAK